MKVLITEDKLQSIFNNMMLEFANLSEHEKEYDYYDYSKNIYIDYSPLNFYNENDDEEWWELDNWIFQYAKRPPYNEPVDGFQTPLLIYSKYSFKSMLEMFGSKFNDLLKVWFESTYDYPVKQVIDDWSAEKFVRT